MEFFTLSKDLLTLQPQGSSDCFTYLVRNICKPPIAATHSQTSPSSIQFQNIVHSSGQFTSLSTPHSLDCFLLAIPGSLCRFTKS